MTKPPARFARDPLIRGSYIALIHRLSGVALALFLPWHFCALGKGLEVESWCATDDIIEQVTLRDYPFALAVQYHPERGKIYDELFADFISGVRELGEGRDRP